MKLLFIKTDDKFLNSLQTHFSLAGFEVGLWDTSVFSAFDMFDRFRPDIFFFPRSCEKFIGKVRFEYPMTRLVCKDDNLECTDDYDLIFTTGENIDGNRLTVRNAFDMISEIQARGTNGYYFSDICLNYPIHNRKNAEQYINLFSQFQDARIDGRIRLFGEGHSGEFYCGNLNNREQFLAYNQTRVCACFKNYLNDSIWEIPQEAYNMAIGGGLLLHNYENFHLGHACYSSEEMANQVQYFIERKEESDRKKKIDQDNLKTDNYFIRCADLFNAIDLESESDKCLSKMEEVIRDYY